MSKTPPTGIGSLPANPPTGAKGARCFATLHQQLKGLYLRIIVNSHVTQSEFGQLVGITQQAVSDLMTRRVIGDGQTLGQWLLAYCSHLREVARARGADTGLAHQRAKQARVSRERNELQLAKDRRRYAPVEVLSLVCAHIGQSVAAVLDGLPTAIDAACPGLTPAARDLIRTTVDKARLAASSVSLADFEDPFADESEDPDVLEQPPHEAA